MLDHQGGETIAVYEHNLLTFLANFFDILAGCHCEVAGCDKYTLACALAGKSTDKRLKLFSSNGILPAFRLQINSLKPQSVFFYHAINSFVATSLGDLSSLGS